MENGGRRLENWQDWVLDKSGNLRFDGNGDWKLDKKGDFTHWQENNYRQYWAVMIIIAIIILKLYYMCVCYTYTPTKSIYIIHTIRSC